MHPNRKFHIEDRAEMVAFVREQGFGVLVAMTDEGLRAAHVPVLIEGELLRFHVAKGNFVHDALASGGEALFIATGVHTYVSPDWYGVDDRVPTWNYIAVEIEGRARPVETDKLIRLLDDLTALHEARLAPKQPWARDKMSSERFAGLLKAISGFELEITAWRGTAKLGQDKPDAVRLRVSDFLEQRGESHMARAMRP